MRTYILDVRLGASLALAAALTACGGTSNGTAVTASPTSTALIRTASISVAGKTETVLTNAQGLTLYYFAPDTSTNIVCSGGCASVWPPLLATSDTVTSDPSLSGILNIIPGPNGHQVMYNGHPLYMYTKDKAAGDANGEGVGGKWHVATPDLASAPRY